MLRNEKIYTNEIERINAGIHKGYNIALLCTEKIHWTATGFPWYPGR